MRRSLIVGLCGAVLVAACTSEGDLLAETSVNDQPSTTAQTSETTAVETTKLEESASSAPDDDQPTPLRVGPVMDAGIYETDVLPIELALEVVEPYRVSMLREGAVLFETPDSSFEDFSGVAILESDALMNGRTTGVSFARSSITVNLTDWASSLDHATLVAEGAGEVGGLSGRWWQLQANSESVDDWAPLFSMADGSIWGIAGGSTERIWALDVDGADLLVVIEAATEGFDAWADEVTETLLDRVEFGEPTGHSLRSPQGPSAGPYKVAHTEIALRDDSRATQEVMAQAGVVVPAASHRQLLLSVGYPSELGGSDASPSPGSFPLLVVAPSLGGSGVFTLHDRTLISQGYVVARVRFPETSFPGAMRAGIHEQPADVSFVLDQLLSDALPPELRDLIDRDHIGMIGHSIGGTATYGLLGSACCADDRIIAGVAHAGTPFDFTDGVELTETPLLIVGSQRDFIAPNADLRDLYDSHPGTSYFLNFEGGDHLSWLDPEQDAFAVSLAVSLGFFDRHLKG